MGLRAEDWTYLHGMERVLAKSWSQALAVHPKMIVFNGGFGAILVAKGAHASSRKWAMLVATLKRELHGVEAHAEDRDAFRAELPVRLLAILDLPHERYPFPEWFVHECDAHDGGAQGGDGAAPAEDEGTDPAVDGAGAVAEATEATLDHTVGALELLREPLLKAVETLLVELAAGQRPPIDLSDEVSRWSALWARVPAEAQTLTSARAMVDLTAALKEELASDFALLATVTGLTFPPGNDQAAAKIHEVQQAAQAAEPPLDEQVRGGFEALLRVLRSDWPDDADVAMLTGRFGVQVLMAATRLIPEPGTGVWPLDAAVETETPTVDTELSGEPKHSDAPEQATGHDESTDAGEDGQPQEPLESLAREPEPADRTAPFTGANAGEQAPQTETVSEPDASGAEAIEVEPADRVADEPGQQDASAEPAEQGRTPEPLPADERDQPHPTEHYHYLDRFDASASTGEFATAYWYAVAGGDGARARAARLMVAVTSSDMTVGSPNAHVSALAAQLDQDLVEGSAALSETISAALVPAALLLPPYSDAVLALNAAAGRLGADCPEFIRIARTLTYERGSGLHTVEAPLLLAAREQAKTDLEAFVGRAGARTVRFHRATEVWRELIRTQGLLGSLAAQALLTPVSDEVRRRLADLEERGVERIIKDTDHQLNPSQAKKQEIIAGAKHELAALIQLYLDLVRGYMSAEESVRAIDKSNSHQNTDLIEDLLGSLPDDPGAVPEFGCMTVGVTRWLRWRLVENGTQTAPRSEAELLARPLVAAYELERGPDGLADLGQVTVELLDDQRARTVEHAFAGFVARHDFIGLEGLLDTVRAETPALVAGLEERERRARTEVRETLQRALDRTRVTLSRALAVTSLTEVEAQEYQDRVERLSRDTNPHFREALALLAGIDEDLGRRQQARLDAAADRLAGLPDVTEAARARVVGLLEAGDLLSAEEFLAQLSNGATSLPEEDREDRTMEGFWSVAAAAAADGAGPTWFADRLAEGRIGHLALPHPGAPVRVHAGLMAWQRVSRQVRPQGWDQMLRDVLIAVGFEHVTLGQRFSPGRGTSYNVFEARYDGYALIPTFGSAARRQYGIFLCWERKTVDGLLQAVRAEQGGQPRPTVVLYFQTLKPAERRLLAEQSRRKGLPNIVIDHAAMAYLGTREEARFDGLMHVSLPFTGTNPYTPFVLGDVPREMFYDRTGELRDVQDPNGPLFVYGGRQLGKSALLKTAMAEFGRFDEHHVSIYLDLKAEGIGEWHKADDLWRVLVPPLQAKGVLSDKTSRQAGGEVVTAQINDWLGTDERRHLLLLLDESDAFLDQDSQPRDSGRGQFKNVYMLKNLMNQSQRRFKPVFAGLHQVQRFHKESNGPMAHVGTEIPVGPLPPAEAYKLVVRPLEAIGYRFTSPDVVWRLLSHTNYQASLIQLFCRELVNDLKNRKLGLGEPPTLIDAATVDKVYENKELRGQIAQRFDWTIQLDNRYRVIALVAAWLNLSDAETVAPVAVLRDQCADFWPAGFQGVSRDEFRALLDEMVGLGVLVRNRADHYGIRSPNVIRLLGSKDEIERKLLESGTLELPTVFDPARYRRQLGSDRSPLTEAQAARVLTNAAETTLVTASAALGADRLAGALQMIGGDAVQVHLIGPEELTATLTKLSRARGARHLLLDGRGLDDGEMQGVFVRLAKALRPPLSASILLDPATRVRVTVPETGVRELVLEPWSDAELRAVEPEADVSLNSDVRAELLTLTGGWPDVLDPVLANGRRTEVSAMLATAASEAQRVVDRGWPDLADRLGIPVQGAEKHVLDQLLDWDEPMARDDLADLLSTWEAKQLTSVLDHLTLTGAVHPVTARQQAGIIYRVNPLIARTIKASR